MYEQRRMLTFTVEFIRAVTTVDMSVTLEKNIYATSVVTLHFVLRTRQRIYRTICNSKCTVIS